MAKRKKARKPAKRKHWSERMSGREFAARLERLGACYDALSFAENYRTAADAWRANNDADWIEWAFTRARKTRGLANALRRLGVRCHVTGCDSDKCAIRGASLYQLRRVAPYPPFIKRRLGG